MNTELATTNTTGIAAQNFGASILAGQLAQSSIDMYERDFVAYCEFAGTFVNAMQSTTLAQWRAHLANETDKSPNTINRMISAVKRLVREAAQQDYTTQENAEAFDQVKGVSTKAMKNRKRSNARTKVSPSQVRDIVNAPDTNTLAGKMHKAFLATLASSGLRVSEIVTLTVDQVEYGQDDDGKWGYVVNVMGKNEDEYGQRPLGKEAHELIQQWIAVRPVESEFIFTGFGGRGSREPKINHIHQVSAWEMVKRYAKVAGVDDVKPHDFRRFVGTTLVKTRGIRAAQKALGHKRIETTAQNYDLSDLERGMTDNLF